MTIEHSVGKIQYAEQDAIFILKLSGEIRLTLCAALDTAIGKLFEKNKFKGVLLDLTEAVSLDSTTLGLLAKLSILAKETTQDIPVLETENQDIIRFLTSMGICDAFKLVRTSQTTCYDLKELVPSTCTEAFVKEKVLEAHKILMNVNDDNKATFKDLVTSLEEAE